MKSTQKIILGIIGLVALIGVGYWGLTQNSSPAPTTNINANIPVVSTTLQLDRGDGKPVKLYTIKAALDSTALAQLQKASTDNGFAVEIKQESFGSYVNAIDGLSGDGAHYWNLSVNGKSSEVGAGDVKLKEGDVIEWKYTKM
ncbi:MAG TPA: DUF4430 domain-containing protein [Patescibacteria group bacterium]|nr:DUF4430 domain-containing protein [Patescibacteria group bacterium]